MQSAGRTDDLAAAILEQKPGDFGQQEIVLDDQDPQAFQQPRRQHDRSAPFRLESDRRNCRPQRLALAVWNGAAPAGMTKL